MKLSLLRRVLRRLRDQPVIDKRMECDPSDRSVPCNIVNSQVSNPELVHPKAVIRGSTLCGPIQVGEGGLVESAHLEGRISIGRYSTFNGPNSDIYAKHYPVTIGSFCSIGRSVSIQEYDHRIERCTSYFILNHIFGEDWVQETASRGSIKIGCDVWIGAQSVVVSGALIGHGAVIGANSVVTGEIPPYAVALGSPARIHRFRFPETIIQRLLALEWWHWDLATILKNRALFDGALTEQKLAQIGM